MALLLGAPIVVLVERSLHTPTGYGLDFYRALDELHRGSTLFVSPLEADRHVAAIRRIRDRARGRRRWLRCHRAVETARPCTRRARVAAARRVGRDGGIRVPHRARQAAARSPHVMGSRPDRAGSDRDPVRHPRDDSGAPRHRPSPARGGRDARCAAGSGVARGRPADRRPRRLWWPPGSRSPSRSASSEPHSSSCGPTSPTLPVLIFRLLGQPGPLNFGAAMAASVILMAITALAIFAIEGLRVGSVGEF